MDVMTLFFCSECGHTGTDESFHLKHGALMQANGSYTPPEYCENTELIKLGATPFDEDEMESIEEFYETRLNQRYEALKEQFKPKAETFEDAAKMMKEALKQSQNPTQHQWNQAVANYRNAPRGVTYIDPSNVAQQASIQTTIDQLRQEQLNRQFKQVYDTTQSPPKLIKNPPKPLNADAIKKAIIESTEHSEKPKKRKSWFRT